jgi:hypothetical protein
MPSPVYQNVVNLIVGLSVRRHMSKFMLQCGNVVLLSVIFQHGKVYYPNSIILLISFILSFQFVGLKLCYLSALALKSPNKISIWYLGNLSNTLCSSL